MIGNHKGQRSTSLNRNKRYTNLDIVYVSKNVKKVPSLSNDYKVKSGRLKGRLRFIPTSTKLSNGNNMSSIPSSHDQMNMKIPSGSMKGTLEHILNSTYIPDINTVVNDKYDKATTKKFKCLILNRSKNRKRSYSQMKNNIVYF